MIVKKIIYAKDFQKKLKKLPIVVIDLLVEKEKIFKKNPLHPSLRLHELKGKYKGVWSFTLHMKYRVIFTSEENGDIFFISIGKHDIYKDL